MEKYRTLKWGMAIIFIAALAAGCATKGTPKADHAQIVKLLAQWKQAFAAKNVDGLMTLYSENFKTGNRDKAAQTEEIKGELNDGLVDDTVITVENATVTIHGNSADVSPITFSGRTGSSTVRLTLAKEQGRWLVIGMDNK